MIVKESDLSGETLNNYKIIGKLGQGGMATVYKAHELSLNRVVALKVLSAQLSGDQDYIKRFEREAQAAAKLNHPNIVQIYSIGSEENLFYFAMEYIKGKSLADIKQEDQIVNPNKAIPIIKQVADALGEAHKAGLVHRDIKPSNIMIDSSGRAKVTDFGIAYVSDAKTKLTRDGSVIGTPEYLSPEQCEGKTVDQRSDIYSLGVTFYELLSGKTPYMAETPVSTLMKIVKGDFPPLKEVNPNVPEAVNTIVGKMMETDVDKRYQSMAEVIGALDSAAANIPVAPFPGTTMGTAVVDNFPPTVQAPPPTPAPSPQVSPQAAPQAAPTVQRKSNKSGLIAAAVIILLIGAAIAVKLLILDKDGPANDVRPPGVESRDQNVSGAPPPDGGATGQDTTAGDTGVKGQTPDTPGTDKGTVPDGTAPDAGGEQGSNVSVKGVGKDGQVTSDQGSSSGVPISGGKAVDPAVSPPPKPVVKPRPKPLPKPKPVVKPLPPARSCIISAVGDDDPAGIAAPYVQEILANRKFTVIDGPSVANRQIADVARNHIVLTAKQIGTRTLNFHGSSAEQYTVRLTLKVVSPKNGVILAGPASRTVEYTTLNAEDNFREAVTALMSRILPKLK